MTDENGVDREQISAIDAGRIYFLPNLMTAGNLFCGFVAIIRCIQAKFALTTSELNEVLAKDLYEEAVWFILAAIVFDILDGRLARLGGRESLFGREFDSIADTVSFGIAPALLVFFLILSPTEEYPFFRQVGWFIGFIYLLCVSVRLARFNVMTHPLVKPEPSEIDQDFQGLPAPAAAGMIVSLVLVLNSYDLRVWSILLLPLMLLIAMLMVSDVRYPSFKTIDWKTQTPVRTFIGVLIALVMIYQLRWFAISILFLVYIFLGLIKHFRQELKESKVSLTTIENSDENTSAEIVSRGTTAPSAINPDHSEEQVNK